MEYKREYFWSEYILALWTKEYLAIVTSSLFISILASYAYGAKIEEIVTEGNKSAVIVT